jgi:hypothetical protein
MNELSPQDLLEFADLDVLGLLDEIDSTRFEAAFQKATPADQDVIRERQAKLASQLVGTSDVSALPESLKARVLESIQSENDAIDSALAPVARIGIGRWRREQANNPSIQPADDFSRHKLADPLAMRRLQRSSAIWRAASFGLIAGLAVSPQWIFQGGECEGSDSACFTTRCFGAALETLSAGACRRRQQLQECRGPRTCDFGRSSRVDHRDS